MKAVLAALAAAPFVGTLVVVSLLLLLILYAGRST